MIYLPTEYIDNCNVVYSNYIRSYTNSNRTQWVDIYINQDYMLKSGSTNYSQTIVCDTLNTYTDNIYYKIGYQDSVFSILACSFLFVIMLVNLRRFKL